MRRSLSSFALVVVATVQAQKQIFNIHSTSPPQQIPGDAPYDIAENLLYASINCIGGGVEFILSKFDSKPYLLVPGTGGNYYENYEPAYEILLGKLPPNATNLPVPFPGGLGYDVCGVSPLNYMLNDIQDNVQYIAYAIAYLSQNSPIPITSWSQGGLAINYCLTFWPSLRIGISNFISFAGDFKGVSYTKEASTSPPIKKRAESFNYGAPSAIQQTDSSNFLKNSELKGVTYAWVKTTSIYSETDDVVQPAGFKANDTIASSFMGGEVGNIFIQQFCPGLVVKHEAFLFNNFVFEVVKLALNSSLGYATQAMVFEKSIPCNALPAPGVTPEGILAIQINTSLSKQRRLDPRYSVTSEPPLRDYATKIPDNRVHGY